MTSSKRLTWLGPVRLKDFKACAKVLGRELDVPYARSLDALARSCGWLSYREMTLHPDPRDGAGVPVVGAAEHIYDLWCQQVVVSYGLQDREKLNAIARLPRSFRYVLAREPVRLVHAIERDQDEGDVHRNVQDPMLRASDWREDDFRKQRRHIVEPKGRPS